MGKGYFYPVVKGIACRILATEKAGNGAIDGAEKARAPRLGGQFKLVEIAAASTFQCIAMKCLRPDTDRIARGDDEDNNFTAKRVLTDSSNKNKLRTTMAIGS
jgi:hypothetical protein